METNIENIKLLFVTSMLEKKNANSIRLFRKIYDYYKEQNKLDDIYDFLWVVYYDFYAINNPLFQLYIDKKYMKWVKTYDISLLLCIIKNMIKRQSKSSVFLLRKYMSHGKMTKIYIGRRPKKYEWLDNFDKKYHDLLRAIYNKDYENIANIINKITDDENIYKYFKVFMIFLKTIISENNTLDGYGKGNEKIKLIEKDFDVVVELLKNTTYKNKKHIFLSCICFSFNNDEEIDTSEVYFIDNEKDKKLFNNIDGEVDAELLELFKMFGINNKIIYNNECYDKLFKDSIIPLEKVLVK